METIKNYLENMFASFPKTGEIEKIKNDLLATMEDKYNELKASGKTENEAIGVVISEFGNIDELVKELGINPTVPAVSEDLPIITREEAETFIHDQKYFSKFIAAGVWLCIIGAASFLLVGSMATTELIEALAFVPLLILVAIAVGLFIYAGIHLDKYKYMEKEFALDYGVEDYVKMQKENFRSTFTVGIAIGVMLCIISPIFLFVISAIEDSDLFGGIALFVLLFLVSFAVYGFIRVGMPMDAYHKLLQEEDYAREKKQSNKLISVVAAIVWPVITAAYLLWSFLTGDWHITWLIWPIAGILFGAFSAVCTIVSGEKQ